jgi:TPR repeat protein
MSSPADPIAHQRLLKTTLALLAELRVRAKSCEALDNVSKSTRFGWSVLLGEILTELQEQGGKIASALSTSRSCFNNFQSLHDTLREVQEFITDIEAGSALLIALFNKSKYKRRDHVLRTNLRAKATQVTSSVMLVMLSVPGLPKGAGGVNVGLGNATVVTAAPNNDVPTSAATAAVATTIGSGSRDTGSNLYSAGYAYFYGIGRARNHTAAFQKFLEASELGDSDAMAMVARCLLHGSGVDQDLQQGRFWLSKAALAGSPAAKTHLAVMLLEELPESAAAVNISSSLLSSSSPSTSGAAAVGLSLAEEASLRKSGRLLGPEDEAERQRAIDWSIKEALRLLLDAASECYAPAQAELAKLNEQHGNVADALKWFQLASNDGCPTGMVGLGRMHLHGRGVVPNPALALNLFVAAGQAGEAEGWYHAGLACERGLPSPDTDTPIPNMGEASRFYQLGAEGGVREAMFAFGYTLIREAIGLLPGSPDAAAAASELPAQQQQLYEAKTTEGIRYLRLASEMGVVDAAFQLGRCYEQGLGVARDEQSAFAQFKSAAAKGHAAAALCAANLLFTGFHSGLPSPREVQQSTKYYLQSAGLGSAAAVNALALLCEDGRVDYESVIPLYPLAGGLNIVSTADVALQESAAAMQTRHSNQVKIAAMLYHHALVLENGDAALNLALLLSSGDVSSFVAHNAQLVTTRAALELLREVSFRGPAKAQFLQLLEKIETVVCVLVAELSRFEVEAWNMRFPTPSVATAAAPASSSSSSARGGTKLSPTAKGWSSFRSLVFSSPPDKASSESKEETSLLPVPTKTRRTTSPPLPPKPKKV